MKIVVHKGIAVEVVRSEKQYLFYFVSINGDIVIYAWQDFVFFTELFSSFVSNFLVVDTVYDFGQFSAKIVQKDGVYSLAVTIEESVIYFTKFECKMVTSVLNRVIARVDVFKNNGVLNPELIIQKEGK